MTLPLLPSLIGATCSGKSAVAVDAARRAGLEILSADSRQVYRRLDAGTAKPTDEERAAVPHHLLDVADPEETYTAARFGREAREIAAAVRERGNLPFLVGGSGLYLRAAETGLFEGPPADPELRARLAAEAEAHGAEALHERLRAVDPESAERLPPADRIRVIRALEVHAVTGIPLSEHHRRHQAQPPEFRFLRFGIEWAPIVLNRRIERRVRQMLDAGWIEEVRALVASGLPAAAPAWNALGYPEVRAHLEGRGSPAEVADRIRTATRQFAKRQRTWFRGVPDVQWFEIRSEAELAELGGVIAERIEAAR